MKTIIKLLLLVPFITLSQEYNTWSIEPSYGFTTIKDITPLEHGNFDIGVRKMFNTNFGTRLNYSYTKSVEDFHSVYLQGIINVGRLLEFEKGLSKNYTMLLGIGGHQSFFEDSNNSLLSTDNDFRLIGTIDNIFKLNNKLTLSLSASMITGVTSKLFDPCSCETETTNIFNINAKVLFYLGKKKEHADWKLIDDRKEIIHETKIINNSPIYNITSGCDCSIREYVFFDNDSYMLQRDNLNAIMKIYNYMELNPTSTLIIKGYASNTSSTSEEYDFDLSQSRSAVIHARLVSLGIELERVKFEFYGKDYTKAINNHDLARRVELLIN